MAQSDPVQVPLQVTTGLGTDVDTTLDFQREGPGLTNRSTYLMPELASQYTNAGAIIPAHTLVLRNQMQLYRTFPKRSGLSRGAAKSSIKYTRDVSVANAEGSGNIVLPLIAEVSFSIPVGVTNAVMLDHTRILASMAFYDAMTNDLQNCII